MMSKKVLMVQGGWEGHTPQACADLFAGHLSQRGFDVQVSDTLDVLDDGDRLNAFSLIVPIWSMGEISPQQVENLDQAVRSGVGLAGFHGGIIDSFRTQTTYHWMTGGQWVGHPGDLVAEYPVTMVDSDHEITRGLGNFILRNTEQYYMHLDPGNHVLCQTIFTGEYGDSSLYPAPVIMPYAWTRMWGKGRVFVAAWGHTCQDFDSPEALELVLRGMTWSSR